MNYKLNTELIKSKMLQKATTITIGKTYTAKTNGNNYNYYKFAVAQDEYIDINFKENQNVRFDFKLEDNSRKSQGTWIVTGIPEAFGNLAKDYYYELIHKYMD